MEKFNKYKPSHRAELNKYLTKGGPTKTAIELRNQLNKDPVSFEKQIEAKTKELSEDTITTKVRTKTPTKRIEDQPGYQVNNDTNILRRIKHLGNLYDDVDFGPEFDKLIDKEDEQLKKLGREPKNLIQRYNEKTPGVTPKAKPGESRKIAEYIKNTQKPFYKIKHKPVKLDFDPVPIVSLKETPEEKTQRENFEKILEDHNRDKAKRVNGGLAYLMGSPLIPERPERNNDNVKHQNQEEDI